MRTETITRTLYSAAELREAHPKGFSRALERWQRSTCGDPHWRDEYRDSLKGALDAIGDAPPTIDGPIRVMAWFENHILAPLRLPYVPGAFGGRPGIDNDSSPRTRRRRQSKYGAEYRPGHVEPCPWTGFCVDDAILDYMRTLARDGVSPHNWRRLIESRVDRLWDDEVSSQCTADYFIAAAEANEYEFDAHGEMH